MKKHLILIVVVLLVVFVNACKKENAHMAGTTTTELTPGTWRVSSFITDSVEIENQFAGNTFDCNVNGVLTIQSYYYSYHCSWNFIDNNHSMCHFHIMGCDDNSILR